MLVAVGFMFVTAPRSEAQVYFSIGVGFPGYYGYYPLVTIIRTGIPDRIPATTIVTVTLTIITGTNLRR